VVRHFSRFTYATSEKSSPAARSCRLSLASVINAGVGGVPVPAVKEDLRVPLKYIEHGLPRRELQEPSIVDGLLGIAGDGISNLPRGVQARALEMMFVGKCLEAGRFPKREVPHDAFVIDEYVLPARDAVNTGFDGLRRPVDSFRGRRDAAASRISGSRGSS
jgi:hypothetical protein